MSEWLGGRDSNPDNVVQRLGERGNVAPELRDEATATLLGPFSGGRKRVGLRGSEVAADVLRGFLVKERKRRRTRDYG
jgi:hypothetical protein